MFKFIDIELVGFTGMSLNNVSRFKLSFKSPYLLILGRNGSGKSRLISMLNPLPPTKDDLIQGGLKRLRLEFNGERYSIETVYDKSLKSTIVNETTGETVIEHANPTVHNLTVKRLFGWTKELNDVITGNVLFTKMSVAERKKWFSILSESDLTYALRFFKSAKDRTRDLEGIRRHLKRTIEELQPRVIENQELLELARESCKKLQSDIDEINVVIRSIGDRKVPNVRGNIEQVELAMVRFSDRVIATDYMHSDSVPADTLRVLDTKIQELTERQRELTAEHARLDNKAKEFKECSPEELLALEGHAKEHESRAASINTDTAWDLTSEDRWMFSEIVRSVDGIVAKLISLLPDLQAGAVVGRPLNEVIQELTEECLSVQDHIRTSKNRIADATDFLKRAGEAMDVECPSCTNVFKPGYSEVSCQQARANIQLMEADLLKFNDALSNKSAELKRLQSLESVRQEFSNIRNSAIYHPVYVQLFDYYVKSVITGDDFNGLGKVKSFAVDAKNRLEYLTESHKAAEYRQQYERNLALATGDAVRIATLKDSVVSQLDSVTHRLTALKSEAFSVMENHQALVKLEASMAELVELQQTHSSLITNDLLSAQETECSQYREVLYTRLAESQRRLNQMDQEAKELVRLTTELAETETSLASSKAIVKAVSPEEGILSEYLHRSMVGITDLMTAYINSVWGYEMCIKPCDFSSGDLDYKFPFWAVDESKTVKDVSKGSKAQQEIINFVFVLAIYRALKLDGYPLLLDEISSGFDEGHKPSMIDYIKQLVDTEQHMQLCMVSHDASMHYRLTHADLCVLDPSGVTLPEKYNENVILE